MDREGENDGCVEGGERQMEKGGATDGEGGERRMWKRERMTDGEGGERRVWRRGRTTDGEGENDGCDENGLPPLT